MQDVSQISNVWEFLLQNASAVGPQLQLIIWGLGLLCVDFLLPSDKKDRGVWYALGGLFMAALHLYWLWSPLPREAFFNMVVLDTYTFFFSVLFLVTAFLAVLLSYRYMDVEAEQHTEYYALILFATSGMMFMAGALDLVTLFVGLELMSISTYVLVGFLRGKRRSNEASMKYFLLGAFSTGIILYGMSLLYGLSGSTNLLEIGRRIAEMEVSTLLVLGLFAMMAGLCFKVAAVPFHMWVPDAYEGAPTAITAFMSVGVKAAAFSIFFRVFHLAFADVRDVYILSLSLIAMLTMTWGNVAAMTQENVKRLLAYSSISHAGYVMMGLVAGTAFGFQASAVYLLAYTFMNLGVWAVVILLRRQDIAGETIEDFEGLFFKQPAIAVLMLLFFLSLAGIPPLGGFIAKYFVFAAVIREVLNPAEAHSRLLVWVGVVGALNVVVALYYYMRVVVAMFMKADYLPAPLSFSRGLLVVLLITGVMTLLIGLYPQPFIMLAGTASDAL